MHALEGVEDIAIAQSSDTELVAPGLFMEGNATQAGFALGAGGVLNL